MRKRAEWMNIAVDPVLELLDETDLALPPGVIHYNLTRKMNNAPSRASISRAIDDLETYGLITKPDDANTYYHITDTGRHYLHGNIDAQNLEPTNDA